MQIQDITEPTLAFLRDTNEAERLWRQFPSSFSRRAYVRSGFAYIEGTLWLAKQACIYVKRNSPLSELSILERALLNDETYELTSTGTAISKPKFIRLPENLRFTVQMLNRIFATEIKLDANHETWKNFQTSVKIRNRLMHPKSLTDYEISETETEIFYATLLWFHALSDRMLQRMLEKSKPKTG